MSNEPRATYNFTITGIPPLVPSYLITGVEQVEDTVKVYVGPRYLGQFLSLEAGTEEAQAMQDVWKGSYRGHLWIYPIEGLAHSLRKDS